MSRKSHAMRQATPPLPSPFGFFTMTIGVPYPLPLVGVRRPCLTSLSNSALAAAYCSGDSLRGGAYGGAALPSSMSGVGMSH